MKFDTASAIEIEKRSAQAKEFLDAVLDPEERPQLVSDEATLLDISSDDEAELSARCRQHYGVGLEPSDFRLPLWQLLDRLEKVRTIRMYRRSEVDKIYRRS
jgi:hypothetical protein